MPRRRRNDILRWKRRVGEDGDDIGASLAELPDDSQSDESGLSDDADVDDSDLSDSDNSEPTGVHNSQIQILQQQHSETNSNGNGREIESREVKANNETDRTLNSTKGVDTFISGVSFPISTDTEAMMNGIKTSVQSHDLNGVDFEEIGETSANTVQENVAARVTSSPSKSTTQDQFSRNGKGGTLADRRRREHEEYKQKRDSDPAFIPNRGAFFMHDHRSLPGQNGYRPVMRGRGRGRGIGGGQSSHASQTTELNEPMSAPWAHDLHHTLNEPSNRSDVPGFIGKNHSLVPSEMQKVGSTSQRQSHSARSFSRTTHVANVQIRVYIPGMTTPVTYSAAPVKQHTRLPNHRPPLRRDKPVRVSLPHQTPRYIFPSVEKSFIFIPRALRPNQQGFGRGKPRGPLSAYGAYSSRRTSAYGGSVYSSSIVLSRRSSLAREVTRDSIVSPSGSTFSRPQVPLNEGGKPVVRLPTVAQYLPEFVPIMPYMNSFGNSTDIPNHTPSPSYTLPKKGEYIESWPTHLPMHQPRPKKTISMTDIEPSVSSSSFYVPQPQEQQPFHQQMPAKTRNSAHEIGPGRAGGYQHNHQISNHSEAGSTDTPLPNIPERAIHAPAFQPIQQAYTGHMASYYYPSPVPVDAAGQQQQSHSGPPQQPVPQHQYAGGVPAAAAPVMAPIFVPGSQPNAFVMPPSNVATVPPGSAAGTDAPAAAMVPAGVNGMAGMVAHESNGMVYYYDPSQMYQPMEGYQSYPHYSPAAQTPFAYTIPAGAAGYYYPQQHMGAADAMYYPPSG